MNPSPGTAANGAELVPLKTYSRQAYLNYAMYVINDRALPALGDGLKPVQRRIVYAMSELGLRAAAKFKKSARTIGDVIGKFHPHGDSACYEAMVLMAQPFSFRYPLVDGQGNWGSQDDPRSFAAMRYTEARLTAFSDILLGELGQGTVDWKPNFDGTLDEPEMLPARLPNVLLNGGSGIAVGMATDIPPHNLREVAASCVLLLEKPRASLEDVCERIRGPDFPSGGEIVTPAKELLEIYKTGRGTLKARAAWTVESGEIVITALPYQTSGAKVLEQIAAQMQKKKLPMIVDLRDESDHENPNRIVLAPRSNRVDREGVMSHLFSTTDLERSYRVNFNVIGNDRRPRVKGLVELLKEWLAFRTGTVRRRLEFRLAKIEERLHILDGLLVAFLNIDEVIRIIRAEDAPKPALMKAFKLSERQAEAILELRLRQLAKLEEVKIRAERDEAGKERKALKLLLGSAARLKTLIKKEIQADAKAFGDVRRTALVERAEAKAFSEAELLPTDPVTVVLSEHGWARAAKGHEVDPESLQYRSGDGHKRHARGKSNQNAVFMDSTGRAYALAAHSLPSARGQGEPLSGRLSPPSGAGFEDVAIGAEDDEYLVASSAGYGFVARLGDMVAKSKKGKSLLRPPKGAKALALEPLKDYDSDLAVAVTSEGRMLAFPMRELPRRGAGKGIKIIGIPAARVAAGAEHVTAVAALGEGERLTVLAGQRRHNLKAADIERYLGERGRRGALLPRGFRQTKGLKAVPR